MVALVVVVLIVAAVCVATVAMATRRDTRVARMPVEPELSTDMWPLSNADEGASTPYQRGTSSAARLAGRR